MFLLERAGRFRYTLPDRFARQSPARSPLALRYTPYLWIADFAALESRLEELTGGMGGATPAVCEPRPSF